MEHMETVPSRASGLRGTESKEARSRELKDQGSSPCPPPPIPPAAGKTFEGHRKRERDDRKIGKEGVEPK